MVTLTSGDVEEMTNVDVEVAPQPDTTEPDAIAALVARVASAETCEIDDEPSAANTLEDDVDDKTEPAWMADIDSRMATVKDMEVKAVNGEYMDEGEKSESDDEPGQFDDLFDDSGVATVDLNESAMKTTSIMAFLETFASGPPSLNGGRVTPTMGEVLERVKARKPDSVPEWTMTAAAAASAYQYAVSKKSMAIKANSILKDARKKHAKLQAKADALVNQLHVIQYGKTVDGKPAKAGVLKPPPHQTRPKGKLPAPPTPEVSKLWSNATNADVCHVCGEDAPDYWNITDEIVFCDGCDIQVHMSCYGLTKLPEGDWYCRGCKEGVTKGPLVSVGTPRGICAFCPHPGGALARVDPPSKWEMPWLAPGYHAHLACALHLPEVFIVPQKNGNAPIVDMSHTKPSRMNLKCSVCEEVGACTQCAMHKCFNAFHPLCVRANGQVALRQADTGQPMAFCTAHSAPEFEQQRYLTCGYNADGANAIAKTKAPSVFWGGDVSRLYEEMNKPASQNAPSTSARGARAVPSQGEDEPKEIVQAFPYAITEEAKRIAAMTCIWHCFAPFLSNKADESKTGDLLKSMQEACKELDATEVRRLNELDADGGEVEFAAAMKHLSANLPKIPKGKDEHADLPPWKYLKQHQIDAVHWMQNNYAIGLGGFLALESGLGKRLTTLAFIQWARDGMRHQGHYLVMCPKETIHLWVADLHRWCTSLRSVVLANDDDVKNPANVSAMKNASFDYIVVTYEFVEKCDALKKIPFKSVICDDWRAAPHLAAISGAYDQNILKTNSTFFLGDTKSIESKSPLQEMTAHELSTVMRVMFPSVIQGSLKAAAVKDLKELFVSRLTFRCAERMFEPPAVPAPLAKFATVSVDGKTNPVDACAHVFQALRKQGHKVLVVGEGEDALSAVAQGLEMCKIEHTRLDDPNQPLGSILYAIARFNSVLPENNISFLLCDAENLRRQQGLLSHVSAIVFLNGNFSCGIDASGIPIEANIWRAANRVWGLNPVKNTMMMKITVDGEDITWKKATMNTLSPTPPACVHDFINNIAPNGDVAAELTEKDAERWDAAMERKRKREETGGDPTWWALHEHNCLYCGGVPGQCKNIPPAFLPPEKAGQKVRCVSCPRITSMGCAYIRTVPQKGWKCPQHSCLVCAKEAAPGHVTFRCVSCSRAFCDSCSSGATFDAIAEHPVWAPSGFQLPTFYEYVRCAICCDSLVAEQKRSRRS